MNYKKSFSVNRYVSSLATDKNTAFILIWLMKDWNDTFTMIQASYKTLCVQAFVLTLVCYWWIFLLADKMRLHISWILLVSSVSLSTAELPSDNDKEGNKKTDVYPGCSITLRCKNLWRLACVRTLQDAMIPKFWWWQGRKLYFSRLTFCNTNAETFDLIFAAEHRLIYTKQLLRPGVAYL